MPEIPGWVTNPSALRAKVLGIVFGALVGGMAVVLESVTTAVYVPIDSALDAFAMAGGAVDSSISNVALSVWRAERAVTGTFVELGASSGLAAPLAMAAIVGLTFAIVFVVVFAFVQVARLVNPQ